MTVSDCGRSGYRSTARCDHHEVVAQHEGLETRGARCQVNVPPRVTVGQGVGEDEAVDVGGRHPRPG